MADQATAKKTLSQLSKREDLNNKICCDCSNPNPQWASLRYHNVNLTKISANYSLHSFAIFICLQCAGVHRGFGVHIRSAYFHSSSCFSSHILSSFVRSISMDTWQDDQVKRMQVTHYFVWCLSAF